MKIMYDLSYLLLIIIPIISVSVCLVFELAQEERTEELIFGLICGLFIDIIYLIGYKLYRKLRER